MRFTPKTPEELEFENLLPKGEYDFEVVKAEDAVSKKSGKEMIKVNLKVFHGEGFQFVTDYLMEAMAFKLRHFFETVGMINAYEAGAIEAADLVGCAGKVKIDIEPASGDYAAKNVVKDYGSKAAKKAEKDAAKPSFIKRAEEEANDDETIPY
jgi:hypothetical protein